MAARISARDREPGRSGIIARDDEGSNGERKSDRVRMTASERTQGGMGNARTSNDASATCAHPNAALARAHLQLLQARIERVVEARSCDGAAIERCANADTMGDIVTAAPCEHRFMTQAREEPRLVVERIYPRDRGPQNFHAYFGARSATGRCQVEAGCSRVGPHHHFAATDRTSSAGEMRGTNGWSPGRIHFPHGGQRRGGGLESAYLHSNALPKDEHAESVWRPFDYGAILQLLTLLHVENQKEGGHRTAM